MDGRAIYSVTAPDAGFGKLEVAFKNPMQARLGVYVWDYGASGSREKWHQLGTITEAAGVWTHTKPEFITLTGAQATRFLGPGNEMRIMVRLPGGSNTEDWALCYINLIRMQFYSELTPFHRALEQQEQAWLSEKQLLVSAEGRAPDRVKGPAARRAAAVRAATVVGQRKMVELLQQRVPPRDGRKSVSGTLKGFTVKRIEYLGEGHARVLLAYPVPSD
jgi:hypothetical protein